MITPNNKKIEHLLHSEETMPNDNQRARYISLDLYPAVPPDVDNWCDLVYMPDEAKENFCSDIGEQYSVQLVVDRLTGKFDIACVQFYPRTVDAQLPEGRKTTILTSEIKPLT